MLNWLRSKKKKLKKLRLKESDARLHWKELEIIRSNSLVPSYFRDS
jgi:hypothetical protein